MSGQWKLIDVPGVMMVKTVYELGYEPKEIEEPKDLFYLQYEPDLYGISYFVKNRKRKFQRYVGCIPCQCEFQSIGSIRSHASGRKHKRILEDETKTKEPPKKKAKQEVRNPLLKWTNVSLTQGSEEVQKQNDDRKETEVHEKKEAIRVFQENIKAQVRNFLRPYHENLKHPEKIQIPTKAEFMAQVNYISSQVMDVELNTFKQKGSHQWSNFKYTLRTEEDVKNRVTQQLQKKRDLQLKK